MAICSGPYFNPRSPCGERLWYNYHQWGLYQFQSTLSLRRATYLLLGHLRAFYPISIHALLAESDPQHDCFWPQICNFNPRSPCGERRFAGTRPGIPRHISIHALLAESDPRPPASVWNSLHFNPRSPCGERHRTAWPTRPTTPHFNPRSPCGERPDIQASRSGSQKFQSTLSLRRATRYPGCPLGIPEISIHALLAESDAYAEAGKDAAEVFQSTLSLRRATFWYNRATNL